MKLCVSIGWLCRSTPCISPSPRQSSSGATPASEEKSKGFKAVAGDHISYQVNDYAKTHDFYADPLGMKVVGDIGTECSLILGELVRL
jgi:hypothetical protein